ncbi:hypothetical protein WL27_20115 [Burkholderia multivorans]|nr:hypothetical protein WL27_20115 [Burkholderia multivorans]
MARIRAHGRDTVATEARGRQRVSMYAGSIGARRRCMRIFRRDNRQCDARHVTSRDAASKRRANTNEQRTANRDTNRVRPCERAM